MFCRFKIELLDSAGNVVDRERGVNLFHDEGEEFFSKLVTGEQSFGSNWYLRLDNRVGSSYSVSSSATGSDGDGYFTVSGDKTAEATIGEPIRIVGSADDDGIYHIASASYDSGSDTTTIYVFETVPVGGDDGTLVFFTVTESDTLSDITGEPDGTNNYSPQGVSLDTNGFTASQIGGDWGFESTEKTITASGGTIGPVNTLFLATTSDNTGLLISTLPLLKERSITDGTSINIGVRHEWGEAY